MCKASQLANLADQLNLQLAGDQDGQMSDFFIHSHFAQINLRLTVATML